MLACAGSPGTPSEGLGSRVARTVLALLFLTITINMMNMNMNMGMSARSTPVQVHHHQVMPGVPYYAAPRPTPTAPPSAKRFKPTPPVPMAAASATAAALGVGSDPAMTIDEEEDTARGDILDHFSPREIAVTRYIQHHEWMEEVLQSPYSISAIAPVDLGLGLRGELESVTKGLLDPPVYPSLPKLRANDPVAEPRDNDKGKILAEFRPRVEHKIAEIEAEMLRMQEHHATMLASIAKTSVYKDAERDLRGGLEFLTKPKPPVTGEDGDEAQPAAPPSPVAGVESVKSAEVVGVEVEVATGLRIVEAKSVVKWELPVDEIVKMGGVVARDGPGHASADTAMNGTEEAFKLDIPTPDATGLLDEFQHQNEHGESMMEDTMVDFMNVEDLHKSTSPIPVTAPALSTKNGTPAGEEMFGLISEPGSVKDMASPMAEGNGAGASGVGEVV